MEATYTDRYREELSDIFSSIIKIDTNFCALKKRAKDDYDKGLISASTLKRVEEADYLTVLDGDASPYALSEEDRLLVVRFTKLSDNGSLYLNEINESFNDLIGRMDNVAKSVKIYFHFYNMDLKSLREAVGELTKKQFEEKKKKLSSKIDPNNEELCKEIDAKILEIEKEEENVLNNINKSNYDVLMQFVCTKFKLVEDYWKWFRVRSNKEKQANGNVPEDSTEILLEQQNHIRRLNESKEIYDELDSKMAEVNGIVGSFATDSLSISTDIGKRINFSSQYNKKDCFQLFEKFYSIPIFFDYCSTFAEEGKFLNSFDIFNKFYERHFVVDRSVDANVFKNLLIQDVLDYYKRKVSIYSKLLEERKVDLDTWYSRVNDVTDKLAILVRNNNDYIADINDNTDYIGGYLTEDMLDRLFVSLNEYFDYIAVKKQSGMSFKKVD